MNRVQETAFIGYSRYQLKPNSNRWFLFFVYTKDKKIYNMMTDLCTLDIDEEMSSLVRKRDFNYVESDDVIKLHQKYFQK
jgi:hypothetical protein